MFMKLGRPRMQNCRAVSMWVVWANSQFDSWKFLSFFPSFVTPKSQLASLNAPGSTHNMSFTWFRVNWKCRTWKCRTWIRRTWKWKTWQLSCHDTKTTTDRAIVARVESGYRGAMVNLLNLFSCIVHMLIIEISGRLKFTHLHSSRASFFRLGRRWS